MNKSQKKSAFLETDVIGIDNLNKEVFYDEQLKLKGGMISLMYNVMTDEVALTDKGLTFLEEFWGFEKIAKLIVQYENGDGDFTTSFREKDEIVRWLNNYRCLDVKQ